MCEKSYNSSRKEWYYGIKLHAVVARKPGHLPIPVSLMTSAAAQHDLPAAKRIVEERVLPGLSGGSQAEVTYLRNETIEDYVYFVNEVSRITDGKKEVLSTVYVREHNSQPFVKDAEGKLTAAADEVEDPIATVYVRIKDSQPFHKDDTTGQLVPYGG